MSASLPRMKFDFPSILLPGETFLCLLPYYVPPSHTGHICLFFYFKEANPKLKSVCNDLLSPQTKIVFFHPHYDFLSPPTLQGQNVSRSPSLPFLPQPCVWALQSHVSAASASDSALTSITIFLNTLLPVLVSYRSHKSSIRQSWACLPSRSISTQPLSLEAS